MNFRNDNLINKNGFIYLLIRFALLNPLEAINFQAVEYLINSFRSQRKKGKSNFPNYKLSLIQNEHENCLYAEFGYGLTLHFLIKSKLNKTKFKEKQNRLCKHGTFWSHFNIISGVFVVKKPKNIKLSNPTISSHLKEEENKRNN